MQHEDTFKFHISIIRGIYVSTNMTFVGANCLSYTYFQRELRKGDTRIQQICGTPKKSLLLKLLKHRWFLGEKSFLGFLDHSGGPWGTLFI